MINNVNLFNLPTNLIGMIIENIDSKERLNLRLISKYINSSINNVIFKHIVITNESDLRIIQKYNHCIQRITIQDTKLIRNDILIYFLYNCEFIDMLSLWNVNTSSIFIKTIFKFNFIYNLNKIVLVDIDTNLKEWKYFYKLNNLQSITITNTNRNCYRFDFNLLCHFSCKQLKHFEMNNVELHKSLLLILYTKFPNLVTLKLNGSIGKSRLFSNSEIVFKQLKILILNIKFTTNNGWGTITPSQDQLPNLTDLSLFESQTLTEITNKKIVTSFIDSKWSNVKNLHLNVYSLLPRDKFNFAFPKITKLVLNGSTGVMNIKTKYYYQLIFEYGKKIKELVMINNIFGVDTVPFNPLNLHLKSITFQGCQIDDKYFFTWFVNRFKSLASISFIDCLFAQEVLLPFKPIQTKSILIYIKNTNLSYHFIHSIYSSLKQFTFIIDDKIME